MRTLRLKRTQIFRVSGGEPGRIEAYFDSDNRLQIIAPDGSVNGSQITIPPNSEIAGNGDAATLFGLMSSTTEPTTLLSGRAVTLPTSTQVMEVTVGGNTVDVTLSLCRWNIHHRERRHFHFDSHICWFGNRHNNEPIGQDYFAVEFGLSFHFCCTRHRGGSSGLQSFRLSHNS